MKYLLSPIFLFLLGVLLLNDFYLKAEFHNFLTGKLSDFAGLFIFPFFFAAIFQKRIKLIYLVTAIFFIYWKSPYSNYFIETFNSLMFFRIGRVIDYTDLFALIVLPLSYLHYESRKSIQFIVNFCKLRLVFTNLLIIVSVFAFSATSYEQDRTFTIDSRYVFVGSKEKFNNKLETLPKVRGLEFKTEYEIFGNDEKYTDSGIYHLDFYINQSICDSNQIKVNLQIEQRNEKTYIESILFRFWCENDPGSETFKELENIFDKEVVEKLQLHLVEKNIYKNLNDKTSSPRP